MGFKTNMLFVLVTFSMFSTVYLRSLKVGTETEYEDELLRLKLFGFRVSDCDFMYDHGEFCSLRTHFFQLYEKRYWYNKRKKKCETFRYAGCKGNTNNFKDFIECTYICTENATQF